MSQLCENCRRKVVSYIDSTSPSKQRLNLLAELLRYLDTDRICDPYWLKEVGIEIHDHLEVIEVYEHIHLDQPLPNELEVTHAAEQARIRQ